MSTTSSPNPSRFVRGLLATPWLRPLNDAGAIDDLLGLVRPTWSLTKIRARIVHSRRETPDVRTLVLEPNAHWPGHRAGQHVVVEAQIRGRVVRRTFSLASPPRADGCVEITVKRREGGHLSVWWSDAAREGDVVTLSKPTGEFVLPEPRSRRLVMISAGSGITPVMSMLRELVKRASGGDAAPPHSIVDFVHVARSREDAIFLAELESLAARHAWLRLSLRFTSESGRLGADDWSQLARDAGDAPAFVCGPAGFMDSARTAWREAGHEAHLRMEHFGLARSAAVDAEGASATATGALVSATRAGKTFVAKPGENLLVAAEAAGLRPVHGCRMGVCHTCVCRKLEGTTVDLRDGRVSSEPGEMIQLCVSAPRTAVTLDL